MVTLFYAVRVRLKKLFPINYTSNMYVRIAEEKSYFFSCKFELLCNAAF